MIWFSTRTAKRDVKIFAGPEVNYAQADLPR